MAELIGLSLVGFLALGPLGWRMWLDRRHARADAITARVRAAIIRRLRGESLVTVAVRPRGLWRMGRIILSVPSGYGWLVEAAWRDVVAQAPSGYELVVRAGDFRVAPSIAEAGLRELRRAA